MGPATLPRSRQAELRLQVFALVFPLSETLFPWTFTSISPLFPSDIYLNVTIEVKPDLAPPSQTTYAEHHIPPIALFFLQSTHHLLAYIVCLFFLSFYPLKSNIISDFMWPSHFVCWVSERQRTFQLTMCVAGVS